MDINRLHIILLGFKKRHCKGSTDANNCAMMGCKMWMTPLIYWTRKVSPFLLMSLLIHYGSKEQLNSLLPIDLRKALEAVTWTILYLQTSESSVQPKVKILNEFHFSPIAAIVTLIKCKGQLYAVWCADVIHQVILVVSWIPCDHCFSYHMWSWSK